MNVRENLLQRVAAKMTSQEPKPLLRIAVDGVDGAGKTTFADELAQVIRRQGHTVIRASVDGFHNPKTLRYRLGRTSPEGFYRDSYDYVGLRRALLDPLGPEGSGRYTTAIFDSATDSPATALERQAVKGDILLFDGLFLHRPELRDIWDDSVFLQVDFEISVPRGAARGSEFGSPDVHAMSNQRYVLGNRLYFSEAEPWKHAGLVVNNNQLDHPFVVEDR